MSKGLERLALGFAIGIIGSLIIGALTDRIGLCLPLGVCFGPCISMALGWNVDEDDEIEDNK